MYHFTFTFYFFSKCKYTSDIVKLELLESQCLPILLYSIECLNLNDVQLREINSWWNSVYRKIFGYNKWESVKEIICLFGRLDAGIFLDPPWGGLDPPNFFRGPPHGADPRRGGLGGVCTPPR